MTEFRIDIVADPTRALQATARVQAGLTKTENAADKLRTTLTRAFTATAVLILARQLQQLLDTFANYQNRLRLVTSSTADLSRVTAELFAIANRTRSTFQGTAELFNRLALASRELGRTQGELLQFTESLNQAIILSGASAQEAQAGLIQLSQGLASGTLRGDELRSVLEQLPAVADVIAKGMGVTRGQLRLLGEQGKISADAVLDAFKKAREELNEKFATTVPTLGQAFTVLGNTILQVLGTFDQAIGASSSLARGIVFLSDQLKVFATNLVTGAAVAVDSVVGFFRGMFEAVATIFDSLAHEPEHAYEIMKKATRDAVEFMLDVFLAFGKTVRQIFVRTFQEIGSIIANTGSALGALSVGKFDAAEQFANNIEDSLTRIRGSVQNFGLEFKNNLKVLQDVDLLPPVELSDGARDLGARVGAAFREGMEQGVGALDFAKKFVAALTPEKLNPNRTMALPPSVDRLTPQEQELERKLDITEKINEQETMLNNILAQRPDLQNEINDAFEQLRLKGLEASKDLGDGFTRAFIKIKQEAEDLAAVGESVVNAFADNATDALVKFAETGKFEFKEFARSLLSDLTRIIARLLIVQALSALGGATGITTTGGGLAHGGTTQPGHSYIVGEEGPELFTPGRTGAVTPNPASVPSAPPQVNLQVVNVDDPNLIPQTINNGEADEAVLNLLARNKERAKQVLS